MARAIYPFHTIFDGDVLFFVSMNEVENPKLDPTHLGLYALKRGITMKRILETDRLYLREYVEDDFVPLHDIFSDSETMKYYPSPFTDDQTRTWISRNQARYRNDGYGLWAVWQKGVKSMLLTF